MKLEFLGTAGYHPSEKRHTSCAFLPEAAPGEAFLLDAGTGFFRLIGRALPQKLHIFLSHAHLDHVFGLTFYLDLIYGSETPIEITLYGARECLDAVLSLFDSPLFPVEFRGGNCTVVEPGSTFDVAGVSVSAHPLTHPGGSLAYRFDWPQKSLAYVTDTAGDARYIDFIRGVDLLIHERNFSDNMHELAEMSGHCTTEAVIRVARAAQVKRLVVTHFNPLVETDPMDEDALRDECPEAVAADDGMVLEF
jgi:ribonuclease BN (tRNA processing enzyme)